MFEDWTPFIFVAIALVVISVLIFFLTKSGKWACTEKGCEKALGGAFHSKEDCEKKCADEK